MREQAGVVARYLRSTFQGSFHVSQEPPGWVSALAGWATGTGLNVSPERALELTDVYACVRVLAESVAMLPLVMYRRVGADGKERAQDHYLYSLLHDAPNPEMTSFTLRETLMGHLGTWGNGYAEIAYNNAGGINALWPLRPDKMKVEREWVGEGLDQRAGGLIYKYTLPQKFGSKQVTLPAERVFHVKGLGFDGRIGYSPIGLQRQAVGLGLAAEEYAARFFANDARPGGVLRHPGKLSEEAHGRLSKSWKEQHQGLSQAHRLAILEEGMEYEQIGLPPEDAQFVATSKLSTVKVARMYRVPLHLIQEQEKQTSWGTGIEQMNIGFVVYTLLPWLTRWEQEIALSLLTPAERERLFAEHLVDGLLRGEASKRYEAYAVGRQWGWLSANDVRRFENMNPVEGGDTYLVPLNMVESGTGAALDASLEDEGDEAAAQRTLLARDYAGIQADGAGLVNDDHGESGRQTGIGGLAAGLSRLEGGAARERRATRSAQGRHRLAMAHLRLYEDVAARVLRREVNDVGNAAGRLLPRRDTAEFSLWLNEFYREHQTFVRDQFAPLAMSYGEMVTAEARNEVGEPEELTPGLEDWIRNYLDTFAARHATVSEGRIRTAMREALDAGEDPLGAVERELEDWPEARAQETARWESVRFNNALAVAIYIGARRTQLRWVAFGESCPYCTDLNGQVVGIRDFFLPAGTDYEPEGAERPLHVGHNVGHAPAHDGCDCMTVSA